MALHDDVKQLLELFWGLASQRPVTPDYWRLLYIENDSDETETIPVYAVNKDGEWRRVGLPGIEALEASDIPDLPASKITSGVFDPSRIPVLDASIISSGILNLAHIPDLPASRITSGFIAPEHGGFGVDITTWSNAMPAWVGGAWREISFRFLQGSDPTVTDDVNAGYAIGSMWSTTASKVWYLVNNTAGAAVWVDLTATTTVTPGVPDATIQAEDGSYLQAEDGSYIQDESASEGGGGGGSGTVTSVALAAPSDIFQVSGSPVTGSGTLTLSKLSQNQNLVLAAPDGSAGVPTFRSLAADDIPVLDASIISSGILNLAHIPDLPASRITTGTLDAGRLPDVGGITPGAYTNANITVDAKGRVTAVANGSGGSGGAFEEFTTNESGDYLTVLSSFADVDSTNMALTITTSGGVVLYGFSGSVRITGHASGINHVYFDVDLNGTRIAGGDGLTSDRVEKTTGAGIRSVSFVRAKALAAGEYTFTLQWKISNATAELYAGAGTTDHNVTAQFWVAELL